MTIAHEFEYHKPTSIDETLNFLSKYSGKAFILAGGTDLINWLREEAVKPEALIDIKGLDELKQIEFKDNALHIGALVTFNELIDSEIVKEKFPLIPEMAAQVASMGVRNRATMAGNICSAVPCCDSGPVLLTYDAEVIVKSPGSDKKIPIQEWFVGPKKTALKPDEFVSEIVIPLPKKQHAGCYVKLGRYKGEDLAQASVSIVTYSDIFKIAFGSVAEKPIRAPEIENLLNGKSLSNDLIKDAVKLVPKTISPITDIRATKEYRLHMVEVMLKRGLSAVISRLEGQGPDYGYKLI